MIAPNLSLIILAFNEEENVAPFIRDCLRYLDGLDGEHEVLVVDDGSSDRTAARAEEVALGEPRVRVLKHEKNQGMGAGMRTGFANARGEYASILAADGQVAATEIDKLLPELNRASIVTSVYSRPANQLYRQGLSFGFRTLMRLSLGTSFQLEGIYLFPVRVARDEIGLAKVEPNTFFFSFELITRALALGHSVATVTIEPLARQSGQSKVANFNRIRRVATEVLAMRRRLGRR